MPSNTVFVYECGRSIQWHPSVQQTLQLLPHINILVPDCSCCAMSFIILYMHL